MKQDSDILKAITIAAEVTQTTLSKQAMLFMEHELVGYPKQQALVALRRAARECRSGSFCLAEVIKRVDDGRPGADEAWSLVPQNEAVTVVWNNEICEAWGCVRDMLEDGDRVGARMAFKAAYDRIVQRNKDAGVQPEWTASLGHDSAGRESVIQQAVSQGRVPAAQYRMYLPEPEREKKELPAPIRKMIASITNAE